VIQLPKVVGEIIGCISRDDGEKKGHMITYCDECINKGRCWAGDIDDLQENENELILKGPFTIYDN